MKGLWAALVLAGTAHAASPERFFDDFSHTDLSALQAAGWTPRSKAGHPGVVGASWSAGGLQLMEDPTDKTNRLLRLSARSDGTPAGTANVQLCFLRKVLEGTYAARVRFSDTPVRGADGDPIIQTFYVVSPLQHDFDPTFSEFDWEYLPHGGWGSERPRLYGVSWQTVRIEPWQAFNQPHEEFGSFEGWHVLMMQIAGGKTRLFIDGRQLAEHGGRNHPVVPMSINFSLWFAPVGLLPESSTPRTYQQDVDWVFHARNEVLSPAQVTAEVLRLRGLHIPFIDTVPAAVPSLESRCDF